MPCRDGRSTPWEAIETRARESYEPQTSVLLHCWLQGTWSLPLSHEEHVPGQGCPHGRIAGHFALHVSSSGLECRMVQNDSPDPPGDWNAHRWPQRTRAE